MYVVAYLGKPATYRLICRLYEYAIPVDPVDCDLVIAGLRPAATKAYYTKHFGRWDNRPNGIELKVTVRR